MRILDHWMANIRHLCIWHRRITTFFASAILDYRRHNVYYRPAVCLSVHLLGVLPILLTWCLENEWTTSAANLYKWSKGKGTERINFDSRWSGSQSSLALEAERDQTVTTVFWKRTRRFCCKLAHVVHGATQLNSTQREFTDAGETPHCPHLFITIKYKTIRHILLVLIYLQFRLGRL